MTRLPIRSGGKPYNCDEPFQTCHLSCTNFKYFDLYLIAQVNGMMHDLRTTFKLEIDE